MRLVFLTALLIFSAAAIASEPQSVFEGSGTDMPKQPQAFAGSDNAIHLTFGVRDQVYYARAEQGQFNQPQIAAQVPNMSLGMRRGPRIAANQHAIVITAIGGAQGKGKDGDVLAYRSTDGGRTWTGPVRVNDTEASAREGLHAMTCTDDGTFWCVWLDLRAKRTELYAASSTDGGLKWSHNRLIYQSPERNICECCHPSITSSGKQIQILFRNSLAGNRDMYIVGSNDAGETWSKAKRLGLEHWELNACPMDGGMLAMNAEGQTTAVWRRGGTVYASRDLSDPEMLLGKGEQSWIAITGQQPHVVWTKSREGELLYSKLDGQAPKKLADNARDPVVVASNKSQRAVVLWESRHGERTVITSQSLED